MPRCCGCEPSGRRRLPVGATASDEAVELHHQARQEAEVIDQPLPEGYTFVRGHPRGHGERR